MDLQEVGWESVEWFVLDQNRDRCWVLVNVVMNLRVTKYGDLLVSQEVLCYMHSWK
jgi:hypothetical protein